MKNYPTDEFSGAMPSIATLERYVKGDMATDERERLEAQIAQDPLLADAVEGMRMSMADGQLSDRMARIRGRVQASVAAMPETTNSTTKRKSRVKPFPQYLVYTAVAAGFALLLVFIGLMRNHEDPNEPALAQQQPTEQPAADSETPVTTEADDSLIADASRDQEEPAATGPSAPATTRPEPSRRSTPAPAPPATPGAGAAQSQPADFAANAETDADNSVDIRIGEEMMDDVAFSPEFNGTDPTVAGSTFTSPQYQNQPASPVQPNVTPYGNSALDPARVGETMARTPEFSEEELREMQEKAAREQTPVIRERTSQTSTAVSAAPSRQEYSDRYEAVPEEPVAEFSVEDLPVQDEADRINGQLSEATHVANLLQLAIDRYDQGRTDTAILVLEDVLTRDSGNITAEFFMAKSLIANGQREEAIQHLEPVVELPNATMYQEARWELARCYLAAGKKRKGKSLLKEIAAEAGTYQQQAAQLLENTD